MSETRWTYYDPQQGIQALGLYHGEDSGNVVIYHNWDVVMVDFMVHQSKTYSFMVNQSLLRLNLQKKNGKFKYKFEREQIQEEQSIPLSQKLFSFLNFGVR